MHVRNGHITFVSINDRLLIQNQQNLIENNLQFFGKSISYRSP